MHTRPSVFFSWGTYPCLIRVIAIGFFVLSVEMSEGLDSVIDAFSSGRA